MELAERWALDRSCRPFPTGAEVTIDAGWIASSMHDLLFVATTHTRIPLLVHTLGPADDRVAAILAVSQAYPESSGGDATEQGMLAYAPRCNEAWARDDPNAVAGKDSFEYQRDLASAQWWQYVCTLFPKASPAALSDALKKSSVPVLAFNGEQDPQDPPANMADAATVWRNSLLLTVPGQGHDLDPRSAACEIPIMKSFIDRGGVDGVDTSCLKTLPPPTFDLTLPQG